MGDQQIKEEMKKRFKMFRPQYLAKELECSTTHIRMYLTSQTTMSACKVEKLKELMYLS